MNAISVKELITKSAAKGTPFLFAVDFDMENGLFIENPLQQSSTLFRTPLGGNMPDAPPIALNGSEQITTSPIPFSKYKEQFDVVMSALMRGDSYLTNLTVKTPIVAELSLKNISLRSRSAYGLFVEDSFVCFSPERFIKIANGTISTNPMKGTIRADIPNAEQLILDDKKETAEHCTIVDLLRNDIGMVATDVTVSRFRYIDRIQSLNGELLQVSSEITGRLPDDYLSNLGDIIFRMLPAGSVSGAPKQSTMHIICQAETQTRGYYTGIFGYFDGTELDTAVIIRFIEQDNGELYFRSGGGITVNSCAESEYGEVLDKIYLPFI